MKKPAAAASASAFVDEKILELADWRGKTLAKMRELIHEADPDILEELKWPRRTSPGTPVFSHAGIVSTGETYKSIVKLTFAKGASLKDPSHLFNSSLDGNVRRAIDIREGEKIDEAALKDLIRRRVESQRQGRGETPEVKPSMTEPRMIAPCFIVKNVPDALAFYRDRLGFDVTYEGPPDDTFFGIVERGGVMIMLKAVGIDPLPNRKRHAWAPWDAYVNVPDPDALAAEFSSRNVELSEPLKNTNDGLRGFELKDADGYVLFLGRPCS